MASAPSGARASPLRAPPCITSTGNPKIKHIVRLRDRRAREVAGEFVIEGFRELRRAVDGGIDVTAIYHCPTLFRAGNEWQLLDDALERGARLFSVSEAVFRRVSYRDRPEGVLGVAPVPGWTLPRLEHLTETGDALLLMLHAIQKPGNLGAMLRTAAATGVDGVLLVDPVTDLFGPNTVRASLGAMFHIPIAIAATSDALAWLRARRFTVVAATPAGDVPLWETPLRGRIAIAIGAEQFGLPPEWLNAAGFRCVIPMPGSHQPRSGVDSLNAATAAALLLFEAVRQRCGGDLPAVQPAELSRPES